MRIYDFSGPYLVYGGSGEPNNAALAGPSQVSRPASPAQAHEISICNRLKDSYNLRERGVWTPIPGTMASACKHPKVRIVSRHDDVEFVECLDCGEVFDSEEFRDMEIEDTVETEDVSDES